MFVESETFSGVAPLRCEYEHRAHVRLGRALDYRRPKPAHAARGNLREGVGAYPVYRDGPLAAADEPRVAAYAAKPFGDVRRVPDAPAHHQQPAAGRQGGHGGLIGRPARGVAQKLVLVYDEKPAGGAGEYALALRFEGGDQKRGVRIFEPVARGNPDPPALRKPLRVLVVGERAGRHGVGRKPPAPGKEELEHERLSRAGRGVQHDVAARPQMRHGLRLPRVRHAESLSKPLHRKPAPGRATLRPKPPRRRRRTSCGSPRRRTISRRATCRRKRRRPSSASTPCGTRIPAATRQNTRSPAP